MRLPAIILRPAVWGFVDGNGRELRQSRFNPLPYPYCDVLRCWIGQTFHLVQAIMIEPSQNGRERRLDVKKIYYEAGDGIDRSLQLKRHAIRMAMQPVAAMVWRHVR